MLMFQLAFYCLNIVMIYSHLAVKNVFPNWNKHSVNYFVVKLQKLRLFCTDKSAVMMKIDGVWKQTTGSFQKVE